MKLMCPYHSSISSLLQKQQTHSIFLSDLPTFISIPFLSTIILDSNLLYPFSYISLEKSFYLACQWFTSSSLQKGIKQGGILLRQQRYSCLALRIKSLSFLNKPEFDSLSTKLQRMNSLELMCRYCGSFFNLYIYWLEGSLPLLGGYCIALIICMIKQLQLSQVVGLLWPQLLGAPRVQLQSLDLRYERGGGSGCFQRLDKRSFPGLINKRPEGFQGGIEDSLGVVVSNGLGLVGLMAFRKQLIGIDPPDHEAAVLLYSITFLLQPNNIHRILPLALLTSPFPRILVIDRMELIQIYSFYGTLGPHVFVLLVAVVRPEKPFFLGFAAALQLGLGPIVEFVGSTGLSVGIHGLQVGQGAFHENSINDFRGVPLRVEVDNFLGVLIILVVLTNLIIFIFIPQPGFHPCIFQYGTFLALDHLKGALRQLLKMIQIEHRGVVRQI